MLSHCFNWFCFWPHRLHALCRWSTSHVEWTHQWAVQKRLFGMWSKEPWAACQSIWLLSCPVYVQLKLPSPPPDNYGPANHKSTDTILWCDSVGVKHVPCDLLLHFPHLHFPPLLFTPAFSTPAFSSPPIYSHIFHSCIFHPCILDRIAFSTPAFSAPPN